MITYKYMTNSYSNNIKKVEVARETAQSVFLAPSERRVLKNSHYETYHDTRPAARAYLIDRLEKSIANAQMNLDQDKADLEKLRRDKD